MPSQNTTSSSQECSESSIANISEEAVNNESGKEMVVDRKEVGQPTGRAAQQGPKHGKYRAQQACVCRQVQWYSNGPYNVKL